MFLLPSLTRAQKGGPVFEDGQAQIVPAFENDEDWLSHDLWVETTFDTDGDGEMDRMHVSVTRPKQTETEGLKLPVIYVSPTYPSTSSRCPGRKAGERSLPTT